MTFDQKQQLKQKLWDVADELRGKMHADEFRDYCLGFIFYKYLSEKQYLYANELLKGEKVEDYRALTDAELLDAIKKESLETLGYFQRPDQLFSAIAKKGMSKVKQTDGVEAASNYILDELDAILTHIEQSTMGTESEEDFVALFEDMDLQSTKRGRSVGARNVENRWCCAPRKAEKMKAVSFGTVRAIPSAEELLTSEKFTVEGEANEETGVARFDPGVCAEADRAV